MDLLNISLPNLLGYVAVAWVLLRALAHRSALKDLARETRRAERRFEQDLGSALEPAAARARAPDATLNLLGFHLLRALGTFPTLPVLRSVLREPRMAKDSMAVDAWVGRALEAHSGALRTRMEHNAALAPSLGLLGTIVGFLLGTYNFSQSRDTAQLMASVAMALGTTLVAAIVVILERGGLRRVLMPLEDRCILHAQAHAAWVRALLEALRAEPKRASRPPPPEPDARPADAAEATALVAGDHNGTPLFDLTVGAPHPERA